MAHPSLRHGVLVFCLVLGISICPAQCQDEPLANFGDTVQVLGQVSLCINDTQNFPPETIPYAWQQC